MSEIIKIQTTRFGELELPATSVIDLFAGLIGFPQFHHFVIIDYTAPFSWLQSTQSSELAFVIINAAEFGENYVFDLPVTDRDLDIQPTDEVAIFNIASIRPNPGDSTVNLKAPVIVNLRNRRGRQIILDDTRFPTRMPLWSESAAGREQPKVEPK